MQSEDYKYVRERCSLGLKWIYSIGKVGEHNLLEQIITSKSSSFKRQYLY